MTAHTVLLAQTKVGFLTGGRKKSFLLLSEDEQMVQLEEAYARATVAITRARSLCLIIVPFDMKGLLGAATGMSTLMYAGHVWAGQAHFYLHDGELSRAPPEKTFIHMLQQNCCLSGPHFSPPQLWRHCKIMSRIITRFVVYTSLLLTGGGLGSTTLPELEKSLTSFGIFLMVTTHIG